LGGQMQSDAAHFEYAAPAGGARPFPDYDRDFLGFGYSFKEAYDWLLANDSEAAAFASNGCLGRVIMRAPEKTLVGSASQIDIALIAPHRNPRVWTLRHETDLAVQRFTSLGSSEPNWQPGAWPSCAAIARSPAPRVDPAHAVEAMDATGVMNRTAVSGLAFWFSNLVGSTEADAEQGLSTYCLMWK